MTDANFSIVELTDEELEQLSEQVFRDEAARQWECKMNEDLAYEGEY